MVKLFSDNFVFCLMERNLYDYTIYVICIL